MFFKLMCNCGVIHYFNFQIGISKCLSIISLNKQRGLRITDYVGTGCSFKAVREGFQYVTIKR